MNSFWRRGGRGRGRRGGRKNFLEVARAHRRCVDSQITVALLGTRTAPCVCRAWHLQALFALGNLHVLCAPDIWQSCSVSSPEEYRKIGFLALFTLDIISASPLSLAVTCSVSRSLEKHEKLSLLGECSVFCTMLGSTANTVHSSVAEALE